VACRRNVERDAVQIAESAVGESRFVGATG
jgi:hypothetical protein